MRFNEAIAYAEREHKPVMLWPEFAKELANDLAEKVSAAPTD